MVIGGVQPHLRAQGLQPLASFLVTEVLNLSRDALAHRAHVLQVLPCALSAGMLSLERFTFSFERPATFSKTLELRKQWRRRIFIEHHDCPRGLVLLSRYL